MGFFFFTVVDFIKKSGRVTLLKGQSIEECFIKNR